MATIEFSPTFANSVVSGMFAHQFIGAYPNYHSSTTFFCTGARFCICSGTVPVTAPPASRYSNVLVFWKITNDTDTSLTSTVNQFYKILGTNSSPTQIYSQYKPAIATGTATWFWWNMNSTYNPYGAHYVVDPPSVPETIYHSIWGTVGVPGSGADLIIPDVNIVTGTNYRFNNLKIQLPTTWSY